MPVFVAGAVCPHPPVLVPELAGGAVGELDELRRACGHAVDAMLAARPDLVVVVGRSDDDHGDEIRGLPAGSWGALTPYGVPVHVRPPGTDRDRAPELPLSLTIGAWLLGRAGWAGPTAWITTGPEPSRPRVEACGRELAARAGRVAVLAMGAGSARRLATGPGGLDPAAPAYDELVTTALGAADTATLLGLDSAEGARLLVTGLGPWQVLAAAAEAGAQAPSAQLLHAATPYGVTYLVASWVTG
ncbi:MAG TPA: hypothetical protein VLC50_05145 [Actinomycetes bacterium]|nr:hypothetical protein [Actinomycetes bacterium]